MNALLTMSASAIWRASWQAALLGLIVVVLVRFCGDRLTARWRFLLWGVVLARLLLVATPGSDWSVFNLASWTTGGTLRSIAHQAEESSRVAVSQDPASNVDFANAPGVLPVVEVPLKHVSQSGPTTQTPSNLRAMPPIVATDRIGPLDSVLTISTLMILCAVGWAIAVFNLARTIYVLRRNLSACRPVTDPGVLRLMEVTSRQMGLEECPRLLVSPSQHSPYVIGAWNPRIVLPEMILTDLSSARLRHVLAHELAHLVRGDLYTNWFLIAARIVHWFNPIAWWTVREMHAERESACDELAFAALRESDRSAYASTIVELAALLTPATIVPGFIGLFGSQGRLNSRVERLLRFPSIARIRAPIAASILIAFALVGLTDAMPDAVAQKADQAPVANVAPKENNHTESGHCFDSEDQTPLAGITVKLYKLAGRTSPAVEIATTTSDAEGRYSFSRLEAPRRENHLDRLAYGVLGFANDRPMGRSFHHFDNDDKEVTQIRMGREESTISGKVIDAAGLPVVGATVLPYIIWDQPAFGLQSATTDSDGRFKLENMSVIKWPHGEQVKWHFKVRHPDFPEVMGEAKTLPADVVVKMPSGCVVSGSVIDTVTGKPGAGAVITARRTDEWGESYFSADEQGHFRFCVLEGRYDFIVDAVDRVCIATTGRDCLAGEKLDLTEFQLIEGGFITGQVVNTVTAETVNVSERGDTMMLGLYGPSQPYAGVISPQRMAAVDKSGSFRLRAAPGENFPYFVNTHGVRMAWDTREQPPVIVHQGETTTYNMLITPKVSPADAMAAARKLVDALSKNPSERTAQILLEFRKLNHTLDECETWCMLMRELVNIGSDAIPQLSAELDQTTETGMLRRLPFALRAIGDARAVPALIRAIPRAVGRIGDYGLIVHDKELLAFMQQHDLDKGNAGPHFGLGSPVHELFGALQKLTGKNFNDSEFFSINLSKDPRRQILQRRIIGQHAQRWQQWWEANWQSLTKDAAFQNVNLKIVDEPMPPAAQTLGKTASLSGIWSGAVLSPAIQKGEHAWHFYDLDSGYRPAWPAEVPGDESAQDSKRLADWTQEKGVDLMCVTHRSADGKETYVLRAIGMNVREISPRELRNIERLIAAGTLPEGRPVGEVLMHFDSESRQLIPEANAAFIFVTREGNMGLIEITDRITRTANMTGLASSPSSGGVGFHLGVQFNLTEIIP